MRIDSAIITGSFSINGDTFNDLGAYTTTGSNTFVGNQSIVGAVSASALTGSISYTNLTDVPTLISGSSQIVGILSSLNSFTASNSTTNTFTSSAIARLNALENTSASVDTLNTTQNTRLTNLENKTGSLATTGSNTFIGTQVITGSLYVTTDLIVQGSSSIQNITGSSVNIGTNKVILNTANPAVRYAGISVIDSGSTGLTGSILWDSTNNNWLYQNPSGSSYTSAKFIAGPQSQTLGSELGLSTNYLMKAIADDHISSSAIYDDGTKVTIYGNTLIISSSGNVGLGTAIATSKLDVYGTSGNGVPTFKVISTSAADSFNYAGTMLNSSLGSGRNYALFIGKSLSTKDSAYIGFNHSGTDGSDTNFVNIGHFNNDYMLNIRANGFVGIGITNPTYKFDILGTSGSALPSMRISAAYDGGNLGMLHLTSNGSEGGGITYEKTSGTTQKWKMGCGNTGAFFLYNETGAIQPLTIGTNGNIGIGTASTTSSDVRLEIYKAGSAGWNPRMVVKDGNFASFLGVYNQKAGIFAHTSALDGWADLYVNTIDGGSGAGNNGAVIFGGVRFTADGAVGIGTTSPAKKLDVYDSNGSATAQLKLRASGNTSAGYLGTFADSLYISIGGTYNSGWTRDGANGVANLVMETTTGGSAFAFGTAATAGLATERMRIDGSGRVTMPYQPAFKAGLSSSTTFGANSTIIFNDTGGNHFNIGGHYSTSTGMFTAPVAGRYLFSACVIYQSMPAGQAMDDAFYIYKNSSLVAYSFRRAEYEVGYTGNGGYYVDHANTLLNLAAGDTVHIRNNRQLDVHGNTNYCFFYGYMLG